MKNRPKKQNYLGFLLPAEEFDFETESGVRGDDATSAASTVGELRGKGDLALFALGHAGDTLVPTFDNLSRTKNELERARLKVTQAKLGIERAETAARLAERRHALVETQIGAGMARSIDLDEATEEVEEAELQIIRARLERDLAMLELSYAAGLPILGLTAAP